MRRRPGLKAQDISAQVAVRREERVRLVQVAPSKREPPPPPPADPAAQAVAPGAVPVAPGGAEKPK
jgi:NADH-quinone oxidoreductase subunit J